MIAACIPEHPVVVCGAGAAGIAAALSAARHGARVLLLESGSEPGGTVAHVLIHTLAGFYDSAGKLIHDGLPRECVERLSRFDPLASRRKLGRTWVFSVCPNSYRTMVCRWLAEQAGIKVLCGAKVSRVSHRQGRITYLEASATGGHFRLWPSAVIDATGVAAVVRLTNPSLVIDDSRRAAGGWIFRMRGIVPGSLAFPRGVAVVRALRQAAECGSLPVDCGKAWLDAGIYEDEVFVKLFVPLPKWLEPQSRIQMAGHARSLQEKVVVFLKQFPDFVGAEVTQTGELGVRDGGRIRGEYTLTREDVLEGRKFDHAVCRCCWPIEYWDPERGVSLEYLPAGACYEIPRSCLKVHGIDNLWAAGKCLSADRYAQSSARVVGACWAMGEAAGKAAANYVIESSRASAKGQVDNFSQTGKLTSATL